MDLLLGFIVAAGVTMVLIPPLIKLAPRWQFIDLPQQRKVHETPIPRVGGIAMAAGVLTALGMLGHVDRSMLALVGGMLVLVTFGVWDDRANLGAGPKFVGQALAVVIVMVWGGVNIDSVSMAQRYAIPEWVAAPLTFVFLVGATNAINLADGLDGLAGGTTLMCLAGLALLAFTVGSSQSGGMALWLIGAVLGFLRYNTYPARVFMGDAGSQLLGFCAAVLSIKLTQDDSSPLSSALPLLLLGVPIIDTLTVMTGRLLVGRSPFKADRNHIHHRLLALGFDHHEAVMVIYLAQAAFFVAAWFMRYESDLAIVSTFLALTASTVAPLYIAQAHGWHWRRRTHDGTLPESRLRARMKWIADPQRLPRWCVYVIALAMASFAVLVLAVRDRAPGDSVALALTVAGIVAINVLLRWRQTDIGYVDKAALYLSAVLLVFMNDLQSLGSAELRLWSWLPIAIVGVAVAIRVRLSRDRRFIVTPLDVLVIIVAAVIPNLPGSIASPQALGAAVAKLVILFYGIETLSVVAQRRWKWLSFGAFCVLIAFALHD